MEYLKRSWVGIMLKIKNLNISFKNNNILNNINFEFEKGLNYVILGPSGVGKSTFLNAIAGLVKEYTGDIENSFESISYSFQEGRLIPWLSVEDNLYYILDTRKNIDFILEMFQIENLKSSIVRTLSGGEKQRVSLARAFLNNPELILMDESLSSLNLKMKFSIINAMNNYLLTNQQTLIYISHNIDEALLIADKIIIFSESGTISSILDIPMNKTERERNFDKLAPYEKIILESIMK